MSKVVIGIFGSGQPVGDVVNHLMEFSSDDERVHIIGPPLAGDNTPARTRFITDSEFAAARHELEEIDVPSSAIEFYTESLRDGGTILAFEIHEPEEQTRVVEMFQRAGAANVTDIDTTNPVEGIAHTAEKGGESIWNDLKEAVQKVLR